jgi:hypothetical protein
MARERGIAVMSIPLAHLAEKVKFAALRRRAGRPLLVACLLLRRSRTMA